MTDRAREAGRALESQFGTGSPVYATSAPGRVNLIGGHTDYNDGFVLPVAIDRRTAVASRPRADDRLRAYSADFEETAATAIDALELRKDGGWFDYVQGVIDRLREHGYPVSGLDLAVRGDVPIGAGVGSSAALEVATAASVRAAFGLDLDDHDLVRIAWEAENEFVGVSCGIMDQFASTFSESGTALFLDCRSTDFELVPVDAERVCVLVFDTTVQHELVHSAYNERVRQCQDGVELFAERLDEPVESLRDVSPAAFEEHAHALPETIRKRCRHVITENERVTDAATALRNGDVERVGELMTTAHESLKTDYETSCEELDLVVELATQEPGVLGSRMTGAGFGGSVVTLLERDAVDGVAERLTAEYRAQTGIDPDVYVCDPADGLRDHGQIDVGGPDQP